MPVVEIIDRREFHRVMEYDAIVEDASNDGDLFTQPYLALGPENAWYETRRSMEYILSWANAFPHPVVLFLHDAGTLPDDAASLNEWNRI